MPPIVDTARVPDDGFEDLLDGLEGEARESRLQLLTALRDDGCPDDEIRRAAAEDRLILLPADRALGDDRRYSRREVAERTGVGADLLRRNRAALGLMTVDDDEPAYGEADVRVGEGLRLLLDAGVPADKVLELNRTIGRAMLQVAAASRAMVADSVLQGGLSEYDAAVAAARAARELTPQMAPVLAYAYEGHLRELLRSDVISASDIAAGRTAGAREVSVAFADLVGWTQLGEEVPAEELGGVVSRLEAVAADLVEKPVTFVKTVGDAVMLVSTRPDPLIRTALALVDADLPALRVGIACGPAIERAGDWYGSPVNQAARVTGVARPASVLVTESIREHAQDDWQWSFARERKLKGVGEVKLFRVRAPEDDGGASDDDRR